MSILGLCNRENRPKYLHKGFQYGVLDCENRLFKFETSEATATLNFAVKPSSILNIQCWNDNHWNNHDASSENITFDRYEIELKPGGYIYEVVAEWDTEKSGYGGIAHYYFYIQVLENEQ